jgi:hypothetical protein
MGCRFVCAIVPDNRIGSGYAADMTMSCPPLIRKLVIAEDPQLAAQISCALAILGHYLPVIEGPRFLPPDPTVELVRRNNAAGRVRRESIYMVGLSNNAVDALATRFAAPLKAMIQRVSMAEEIEPFGEQGLHRHRIAQGLAGKAQHRLHG